MTPSDQPLESGTSRRLSPDDRLDDDHMTTTGSTGDDRMTTSGSADDRITVGADSHLDDRITTVGGGLDNGRITTAGVGTNDDWTASAVPPADDRLTSAGSPPEASSFRFVHSPPPASRSSGHDRFQPGALVLEGKYELVARMKGGAQAMAFQGRRVIDDEDVFIKVQLNPGRDPHVFDKPLNVAKKLLSISHPLLMHTYDVGLDGGALCEVFEFVKGAEFSEWIAASRPLSDAQLERVIGQLAEALNALHNLTGLAHRDLKPENLIVETHEDGPCLRIVDYGTASHLDSGGVTTTMGTRDYSPPEFYGRRIENDALLRSWDWWSVGRILQEVIDGSHPKDFLRADFPGMTGSSGQPGHEAVMAMFDSIMLESNLAKYQMRAGMVELSEKNPANARWMPLLRGLLTTNRAGRWGHDEVTRFLRDEKVPNAYHQPREVDGFLFEQAMWALPDLAKTLAAQSRDDPARWETAKQLLHGGEVMRYVCDTLRSADIERGLRQALAVPDRDLATALALSALAGVGLEPAVCGVVLDRAYARSLSQGDDGADATLRALLSDSFLTAARSVAPAQAAPVAGLAAEVQALRDRLVFFDIVHSRSKLEVPIREHVDMATSPPEEIIKSIVMECRPRFVHTKKERLQALYADSDLARLPRVDLLALRISLNHADQNQYVTCETYAAALRQEGLQYAQSAAVRQAYGILKGPLQWHLFVAEKGKPAVLWAVLAFFFLIHGAYVSRDAFPAGFGNIANVVSVPFAALAIGLLFLAMRKVFQLALHKTLAAVYPGLSRKAVTRAGLQAITEGLSDRRTGKELAAEVQKVNGRIRAIPSIDQHRYEVRMPQFILSRFCLVVLAAIGYAVLFQNVSLARWVGGAVAGATGAENRVAAVKDVAVILPEVPPASFRAWIHDLGYTMHIWDLRNSRPGHHIDAPSLLADIAVTDDVKALQAIAPLRDYEAHTAQLRLWPYYHDLFSDIHAHAHAIASSASSPFVDTAWKELKAGGMMRYQKGLGMAILHRPTDYQPWTNPRWQAQLKHG